MIVLVTGAAGFVGAHLVRRIAQRFPQGRVIAADAAGPDAAAQSFWAPVASRIEARRLDVADREAVAALVRGTRPTHVVHAAAVTPTPEEEARDPTQVLDVNLGGTINVVEAATAFPGLARLIAFSSSAVYGAPFVSSPAGGGGPPKAVEGVSGQAIGMSPPHLVHHASHGPPPPAGEETGRLHEDCAPDPSGLYGIAKAAGEAVVQRFAELRRASCASLRVASVYGPLERPTGSRARMSHIHRLASALASGRPVALSGPEIARDFVHADDVAQAVTGLLAAPALNHAAYNVGSGRADRWGDVVALFEQRGLAVRWTDDPEEADIALTPADARATLSIERLRAETRYAPRSLADGIAILFAPAPALERLP